LIYAIQLFYLRTSRQLRLLDIEAKAPLFSHFLETLDGIMSIRAFGWTKDFSEKSRKILDESQKPYYLMWCIQRWLTLVLDLLVAGLAVLLVATAMEARTPYLGVALFSLVSFSSTLQQLVTEWTQLETGIGAVNRVRAFTLGTETEDKGEEKGDGGEDAQTIPPDWPKNGSITFANVTASYHKSSGPVLEQVSFSIHPGQKVAICGRTGRYEP
jgi:ABC-type multidrug transport system fused ATPase/permease subunit